MIDLVIRIIEPLGKYILQKLKKPQVHKPRRAAFHYYTSPGGDDEPDDLAGRLAA